MKLIYSTFLITIMFLMNLKAQTTIDFDSEPFIETEDYGSNTYTSGNFRLIFSSGNFFEDTNSGENGSNCLTLLFSNENETLTIESIDETEFKLESFFLSNFFGNGATIEGFRDNNSIATQSNGFPASGSPGAIVSLNTNFENIDKAVITFSNGAFDAIDSFKFDMPTLNISNLSSVENKIKLSPNPSTEFILISGLSSVNNYKIYNLLGKEIKNGVITNDKQIDIRDFKNGLYFFKFVKGNTIKFIKK